MNKRLLLRLTGPVVAISLLLLAMGVGTAWHVGRWQKAVASDLRVNVSGVRAAEELEILVRETRTRLDHYLITGDRKYLAAVPALRPDSERWLAEAERWADTPREQELMTRAKKGIARFWQELGWITAEAPAEALPGQIRGLIDSVLTHEVLEPTHEYLDLNEVQVEDAIAAHQVFADRLMYGLLLVGICGSAAGLVAGFGFARGLNRSLIQLSVLVRDAAGHLQDEVAPVPIRHGDLGQMENVLRLVVERVGAIVQRLQQREREAARAEQLAAIGQLAAGMAHELRNPLMAMKILVQGAMVSGPEKVNCLAAEPESSLQGRDLIVLEEEISRQEHLVQSFLDFARPPEPEKRVLDVRPLIQQTLALVTARATACGARIEFVPPPQPVLATLDPGQFRQVLLNLILNALDAMPGGGIVGLGLTSEQSAGGGWLTLDVADEGCGLPPSLDKRLFEPFATTKETGLGLGLSICKRIVTAHGGQIAAANRAGRGAIFTVKLPLGQET
jgi:signal transduction histidine kinase